MNISRARLKTTDAATSEREGQRSNRRRRGFQRFEVLLAVTFSAAILLWVGIRERKVEALSTSFSAAETPVAAIPADFSPVFKPNREPFIDSVKEYLQLQSTPVQPIAFNHQLHLKNGMECASCHMGVTEGPDAGIPSVSFCMACHQEVATNNPEIKKLTAYAAKEQEVPWQPVYWFYPSEHVRFWHAPHIRAGVDCKECHGDMTQQTVAVRSKKLNMNFCISCHRAKGASADCTTCHN
ncbi:MAG: cytochrome c3 family protein [Candidatus Acidiferrum sp.]